MMQAKNDSIFGTDGIRGRWGQYPLDPSSIIRLGNVLAEQWHEARVLIGRDTRQSGPEIESLLSQGIGARLHLHSTAIVSTPALAYLTKHNNFDFGIMLSASHNAFHDNGIKIFNRHGEKLNEVEENEISRAFHAQQHMQRGASALNRFDGIPQYLDYLISLYPQCNYPGRIVADCANGSASAIAAHLFNRLGIIHDLIACQPDGININADSGSTAPRFLQAEMIKRQADIGIAFDGDADRVIFVDRNGVVRDGDHTLFILARYFQETDKTFTRKVVGTIMSNFGLELKLKQTGIEFIRSAVGDKYVYAEMKTHDAALGGEASGHTIIRRFQTSGDGFLTALMVLNALNHFGCSFTELAGELTLFPQKTINIKLKTKKELTTWAELNATLDNIHSQYGSDVRFVLRYSGTEPVLRVMMESANADCITKELPKIVEIINREIGE